MEVTLLNNVYTSVPCGECGSKKSFYSKGTTVTIGEEITESNWEKISKNALYADIKKEEPVKKTVEVKKTKKK